MKEVYYVMVFTAQEIEAFLEKNNKYVKTFEKAIGHEKANSKNPNYLGWQWHDVETLGTELMRLIKEGFIRVNSRSKRGTYFYRLNEREEIAKSLKKFMSPRDYEKLRRARATPG